MEIEEFAEKVYESANDEGYVQIEGVVFPLQVKNNDDSLKPGKKVMIQLPAEEIISAFCASLGSKEESTTPT